MRSKIFKIISYSFLGFILCCVLVLIGFLVIPPEKYQPESKEIVQESEYLIQEKVGWYLLDDGSYRMVTWGAESGITINRFDTLAQSKFIPKSETVFISHRSQKDILIEFDKNSDNSVEGYKWIDDTVKYTAKKLKNFKYNQEDVKFYNGDIELSGLLLKPVTSNHHTAVVLVHGSGESDRQIFWYLYQADYLVSNGITVLLPDKRGCGKSDGEWHTASINEFAEDAIAGVNFLLDYDSLKLSKIGLMGLSQGGMIAPLAADLSDNISFVINVSGSATTFDKQVRHEISNDIKNGGCPSFLVPLVEPVFTKRAKAVRPVWWAKNSSFTPVKYWNQIDIPVLCVYGSEDEYQNVPVDLSIEILKESKRISGNQNFTIKVYEGSGHALGDPETGWIKQEYLKDIVSWILDL